MLLDGFGDEQRVILECLYKLWGLLCLLMMTVAVESVFWGHCGEGRLPSLVNKAYQIGSCCVYEYVSLLVPRFNVNLRHQSKSLFLLRTKTSEPIFFFLWTIEQLAIMGQHQSQLLDNMVSSSNCTPIRLFTANLQLTRKKSNVCVVDFSNLTAMDQVLHVKKAV